VEDQQNSRTSGHWRITAALLLAVSAYLYATLFVLPNTPILRGGDQTYFWTDGQRMLFGERPYQDFFQFTPPGTDVFFFGLFKWFGPRIWVTNMAIVVLGAALCWVCFAIARQIMSLWSALLATLLFLTLVYAKLLNATHHWFSMLLILCAVRVAMGGTHSARLAIVGLLLGAAAFFTHTHALAALLASALFLVWQLGNHATRLIWTGVVCLGILTVWSNRHRQWVVADLPAGSTALSPVAYEKWTWVSQHTRPGDFFFQPPWPSVYLPLALRSPVFAEGLGEGDETRPEFVDRTIHQLEAKQVRFVLWSPHLEIQGPDNLQDHLQPFRAYLHDRYARVRTFSDQDEIWQRK